MMEKVYRNPDDLASYTVKIILMFFPPKYDYALFLSYIHISEVKKYRFSHLRKFIFCDFGIDLMGNSMVCIYT